MFLAIIPNEFWNDLSSPDILSAQNKAKQTPNSSIPAWDYDTSDMKN